MASVVVEAHDDRVLGYTRVLSVVIVPFLLVAFVLLDVFPGDTKNLFAWTIKPTMTPMVLTPAYLGGLYFFLRVLGKRRWNVVKSGFLSVALFASLLGVATIVHWDTFNHAHGGWLANQRLRRQPAVTRPASASSPDESWP
jgi:hypothetical protein